MNITDPPDWGHGPGLIESIWRYRLLVLVATVVAGIVGYGLSQLQDVRYEATAQLLLADQNSGRVFSEAPDVDPERFVTKQAERAESTPVLARASQILDGELSTSAIARRVSAEPVVEIDQIVITARAPTADGAAALADAVAVAYRESLSADVTASVDEAVAQLADARAELQDRVDQLEEELTQNPEDFGLNTQLDAAVQQLVALQTRGAELTVDGALRGSGIELYEPAVVPDSPFQPKPARNGALTALLGFVGAGAFGYWRAGRSRTAESSEDPQAILGAPLLGEVPVFRKKAILQLGTREDADPAAAEAYQFVVSSLQFALADSGGASLLFTSPSAGDGKTLTALNVAAAIRQDGRRVVLVDADLRARGLSRLTDAPPNRGLSDLAIEDAAFEDSLRGFPVSETAWLPFVAAGRELEDPAGFFRTPAFRRALGRVKEQGDLVMVDSPPILAVSDTSAIAGQVDGIVLIVNRGTPLSLLESVRERLAFIGTPLLGYVFNRASRRTSTYPYGYAAPGASERRWPSLAPDGRKGPSKHEPRKTGSTVWSAGRERTTR